jgi:hypothetical protein
MIQKDECRNIDTQPFWGAAEWTWDQYKSIRMFHGKIDHTVETDANWWHGNTHLNDDGSKDHCRFYEAHDCTGEWYTECQGHCNLKQIYGKLRSVRCHWNTTYYPS